MARVIKRLTGIALPSTSTWRLLHQRLGWTVQWPERKAKEAEVTPVSVAAGSGLLPAVFAAFLDEGWRRWFTGPAMRTCVDGSER